MEIIATEEAGKQYASVSYGGNAFLVNYNNAVYLVTAGHVKGTFQWPQMVLTGRQLCRRGDLPAKVDGPWGPTLPLDGAAGSDVMDLSIFKVNEPLSFFYDPAYIIDKNTVGTSNEGDKLLACGSLKEASSLVGNEVETGFSRLELDDAGYSGFDPVLRTATAEYNNPDFSSITGLSGSPVFNVTQNKLAGMIVRGGLQPTNTAGTFKCIAHYVDIFDLLKVLDCVHNGKDGTHYFKDVVVKTTITRSPILTRDVYR
jgi:hypothetical protein